MSYCESCGRVLRTGAVFCSACGAPVAPAAPEAPPGARMGMGPGPAATPAMAGSGGGNGGAWLVVVGGLLVFVMSFILWGVFGGDYGSGWSPWSWQHSVGASKWRTLWPPHLFGWSWWRDWRSLIYQGLYVAAMAVTVLCVIAAIQALRRGLAGVAVSGSVLRGFGIAAAAVFIAQLLYSCALVDWRVLYLNDLAAIIGAVLIIVGGSLMGAPPPRRYASAPTPGWR